MKSGVVGMTPLAISQTHAGGKPIVVHQTSDLPFLFKHINPRYLLSIYFIADVFKDFLKLQLIMLCLPIWPLLHLLYS